MAKKQPDPESMDATVRRKLSEEEVADRGRRLAEELGIVKGLREEKKEHADRLAKQIEDRLDECEVIRLEILEGQEESRQGDLFAGPEAGDPNAPPKAAALGALAEVAKRAGDAPFGFTGNEPPDPPVQVNAEMAKAKRGGKGASA